MGSGKDYLPLLLSKEKGDANCKMRIASDLSCNREKKGEVGMNSVGFLDE